MKRSNLFGAIVLVFLLIVNHSVLASSNEFSLNKASFQDAEDFYKNNVDKKDYKEFVDSKLTVRELIMVKDIPKVFDEKEWKNYSYVWRKQLKEVIIENTKELNPEQQVYYFFSLKDDGEKIYIKDAMYDGKTEKIRLHGGGQWTKEEFKQKFEQ